MSYRTEHLLRLHFSDSGPKRSPTRLRIYFWRVFRDWVKAETGHVSDLPRDIVLMPQKHRRVPIETEL